MENMEQNSGYYVLAMAFIYQFMTVRLARSLDFTPYSNLEPKVHGLICRETMKIKQVVKLIINNVNTNFPEN